MFCPKCGAQIKDGSAFCGNCGAKIEQQAAAAPKAPEKKKRKVTWASVLGFIIAFIVFFAARRLASGALDLVFGKDEVPSPTPAIAVPSFQIQAPQQPLPSSPPATAKPAATPAPTPAPTATPALAPAQEPVQDYWDWQMADESEIRDMMKYYLTGRDSATGYRVAFFMDEKGEHGGYYFWQRSDVRIEHDYQVGSLFYSYQIGSLEEIGDDYIVVVSNRGRTTITLDQDRADSVLFNTDALDYFPKGVRLYKDNTGKEDVLKHLLSINETLKIFAGIEGN